MSSHPSNNNLAKSFRAAFLGIILVIKNERNIRIQFLIAILAIAAGILFKISPVKWMIVLLLFAVVISAEIFNSALEKLADMIEPNVNMTIRDIKDIAAGAVLWSAMVAVIVGLIIFVPEILEFIE
ncbi:MAG: hypothetical protein CVU14_06545 [Bacteroidetes bacterium HGW-Bacteroidetes-9]|jgi:diacylglycerol kinase|nr:MAG: hypothetical protein CVU14_06545 [Bacteroidetes bacterium HGW-Bacteroidetes-9]